jgi:hypothetical protein
MLLNFVDQTPHPLLHISLNSISTMLFLVATGCATAPESLKDTWEITIVGNQRVDTTASPTKRPMFRLFEESKVQGISPALQAYVLWIVYAT